jgi:hypothetical protein
MIFDKEKLLSVYDLTKDAEPSRTERARAVVEDEVPKPMEEANGG